MRREPFMRIINKCLIFFALPHSIKNKEKRSPESFLSVLTCQSYPFSSILLRFCPEMDREAMSTLNLRFELEKVNSFAIPAYQTSCFLPG